jgi:hypothetical protein
MALFFALVLYLVLAHVVSDGNKSLYLVFVGRVVFLSILDCF